MKQARRLFAFVAAIVMAFAVALPAWAEPGDPVTATAGKITIENAAKGETYKLFKIFDATISKVEGESGTADSVAYIYSGTLPNELATVFKKVGDTNYVQRIEGKTDAQVTDAVNSYVATLDDSRATSSAEGTGSAVVFDSLGFGYYAVKSTQGAIVTIDSANPEAVIYDKNTTTPTADKKVDEESYSIGDTVKYTATFDTATWLGAGADAKQVTSYVISDTLPEFLSNVVITSVKVITTPAVEDDPTTTDVDETVAEVSTLLSGYTSFANKQIEIPWARINDTTNPVTVTSLYPNGAIIEIKYEGKLTSVTNVNTADTNTVTIQPKVWNPEKDEEEPWNNTWSYDAEIKTYAAALKKVDGQTNPKPLAGAKFKFNGLTVSGSDGVYTVVTYDSKSVTPGTEMEVDSDGKLYIVGLASDVTLTGVETVAPDGYNKLTESFNLKPQLLSTKIYKESGTIKYDAKGNVIASDATATQTVTVEKNLSDLDATAYVVVNNKGTELPSTGGIGTTIFYVVGGLLVAGAAVSLVVRRRAAAE